MAVEKCSKCDVILDRSAQAYVFGGDIVCYSCDKLLRDGYEILGRDVAVAQSDLEGQTSPVILSGSGEGWDLALAKKRRKLYILFFALAMVGNLMLAVGIAPILGAILYLPSLVLFLVFFLSTARLIKKYSAVKMVFTGLGLFVPVVSLIILFYVDRDLYKRIRDRENPGGLTANSKRRFCSWGLYSFLLILIPFIGLPLGVVALVKISKSEGMLYGKILAWVAVAGNAIMLLLFVFVIVTGLMAS